MGDLEQLETQLSSDAKMNARDGCGLTALMLVARGGMFSCVGTRAWMCIDSLLCRPYWLLAYQLYVYANS